VRSKNCCSSGVRSGVATAADAASLSLVDIRRMDGLLHEWGARRAVEEARRVEMIHATDLFECDVMIYLQRSVFRNRIKDDSLKCSLLSL
jgi:hypothetical protein